jgi:lipid A 3-O-deacylase
MNRCLGVLLALSLGGSAAPAGLPTAAPPSPLLDVSWPPAAEPPLDDLLGADLQRRDPFRPGQCGFQFMGGYYQKTGWGPGGPHFNYAPFDCRYGLVLTTPCDQDGWLRGCVEALFVVNYSTVVGDFGNYVAGPSLLLRYNFVQQESAFVPYLQAGAGFGFNDAYKNLDQDLIGGRFEFLLRGEVGARVMLTEQLSLDAELGFQHISNGTLHARNGGINNLGFGLGFTYFFGKID